MGRQEQYFITPAVTIPASELTFTFSRSSGKGGQHVNKVSTRVTLWFDVEASQCLSTEEKERIRTRLAGRINRRGLLYLDADSHRSQSGNRDAALERFVNLMRSALHVEKSRRKTKPSMGAKKRRLQAKKYRSRLKKQRSRKGYGEE